MYIFGLTKHSQHELKICLEHSFHLLVNGQFEYAKRQLSIAESWRYGKQSADQSQRIKLIQSYSGFLDYFIWCGGGIKEGGKKATVSSTDEYDAGVIQEMHSYFRQSFVNLKDIMKLPGVWDPFVLSYIDVSTSLCFSRHETGENISKQNGEWYYLNFTLIFILRFKVVCYDLPY
nr:unnamed protein product [Salmo salar]|eukprot:XP_013999497.1 PREDICTED: TATA box-binding protein-associated factor RNA polymerase I subunit A-like [Salmo salar]